MLLALLLILIVLRLVVPWGAHALNVVNTALVIALILWLVFAFGGIGPLCLGARCG